MPRDANDEQADASLPLLLLPGTLCDERLFAPLRERLHGTPTRVLLTLRARTLAEAAEDVLARAPEKFGLLGFSLGGLVAITVAMRGPRRVRQLVLLSTTPRPVPPEQHERRRAAVEDARRLGMRVFVRQCLWPDYRSGTQCNTTQALLEDMAETLGQELFARQTQMALARDDLRPRLAEVRCPTLVLAGADDQLCPPVVQQEFLAGLPNARGVMLPDTGHLAILEKPDEVAAAVAAWCHGSNAGDEACAPERQPEPSGKGNE